MATGDPGDGSVDPLGMLRDIVKVLGVSGGGAQWMEAARTMAQGLATDGKPESNGDPLVRIRLEELGRVAELHVAEATGLPVSGDHAVQLVPVGRGAWAARALEAYRPWVDNLVRQRPTKPGAPPTADPDLVPGGEVDLASVMASFSSTLQPMFTGFQFGSAVGHLARRALGPYALPLPWTGVHELALVPENIAAFADDWSLDLEQTELWVCVRELTAHAVLTRPHVTAAVNELLGAMSEEAADLLGAFVDRLGVDGMDPTSLQDLLSDPESLVADLLTPGSQRTSERLTALAAAVGGYVDHVTARVAASLTGSAATLTEAWYRYRVNDAEKERAAAALFGLDLGREQVDRGAAFVTGVVERAGEDGLLRLWTEARTLPTPAEVDAPGLWLERISLPPLEGDGAEGATPPA